MAKRASREGNASGKRQHDLLDADNEERELLEFEGASRPAANIRVVGVGGGGGNALNNMVSSGLGGVEFIAANTDAQALQHALAPNKVQLGGEITRGLGCGADPTEDRLECGFAEECRPRTFAPPSDVVPEESPQAPPSDPKTALIAAFPGIEIQLAEPQSPPTVPGLVAALPGANLQVENPQPPAPAGGLVDLVNAGGVLVAEEGLGGDSPANHHGSE